MREGREGERERDDDVDEGLGGKTHALAGEVVILLSPDVGDD